MSNIASTLLAKTSKSPQAGPAGPKQREFNQGTRNMLDEARAVAENAVGQGQQLNPIVYQMLGLKPIMQDNSADLQTAQGELDAAQQQYEQASQAFETLKGIPKGKRSKQQKQQFRQLKKELPKLTHALGQAKETHGRLSTMPNQITGFERLAPEDITAESPFSAQNALHQAQATESERLNQYLAGGEVDPTLKQQYNDAEQRLRANLSSRYGADYENSSVGQMALQNFARQKNEAFATWNQQMVEKYNNLAFQGQANLQNLLGNQIGLMREPGHEALNLGTQLSNIGGQRLAQQSQELANRSARQGLQVNSMQASPAGLIGSGLQTLAQVATTPTGYDQYGNPTGTVAGDAARAIGRGASGLYNWATGAGQAAGTAAATDAAVGAGTVLAADAAAPAWTAAAF